MASSIEKVKAIIESEINKSEIIDSSNHLLFKVKSNGLLLWKNSELHISGRVEMDKEKSEIDRIIDEKKGEITIVNTIRVKRT